MRIEIYGSGCQKCDQTYAQIQQVLNIFNMDAELVKVEDMAEIMGKGIMITPAVYIDDKKVHAGSVPSIEDIKSWLN